MYIYIYISYIVRPRRGHAGGREELKVPGGCPISR